MANHSPGFHLQTERRLKHTIYLPHRYTTEEQLPLVVMLHWGGKKFRYISREIMENLGIPGLTPLQAVLVAPDRKRRHWALPKAVDDLRNLLAFMEEEYQIHPTRRIIAGYGMGGIGVWYIAQNHPEMFNAGISMAAPIPSHVTQMKWRFPIYCINSKLDEVYPYDLAEKTVNQLQENGAPIEFSSVEFASQLNVRDYIDPLSFTIPWIEAQWGNKNSHHSDQ